ncbi:hypothetical protein A2415_04715 [candidate division WWE3 bacterium RIFOXYC1_FULL_39_7]|uniref:Uncharacterized protein n=2 Tax=Katanobacteria TaxID=422282 RepID=A0A1F4X887_UNCKA|nr:MAG: hypothetical protein A2415_04715 [candidate division WWE3 bacterium RIFOXYC1_FULL_39_7]OGC77303.1 MAG: hypothetical protein A2619_04675 [candidate division WWE3 bacterium RIFOXYD1_FULL_39_9]
MIPVSTRQKGKVGEIIGRRYLELKGYRHVTSNWYCNYGEIDHIFTYNSILIFTEVKFVTNVNYCRPEDLFNYRKRAKFQRAIRIFLNKYRSKVFKWRADLVCITQDEQRFWIQHYCNVLGTG